MEHQSLLSIPWLDAVIHSNWWPLLLPVGYTAFRFVEYLLKRRFEGKPASEKIEQYNHLADLQERLDKGGMTIGDLKKLRAQVFNDEADNALQVAERYTAVAQKLVSGAEDIEHKNATTENSELADDADWGRKLTQLDMNILSQEKASEANNELTATILDLMQRLSPAKAAALQRSQDFWEAFREAEAERESQAWEGGSIRPLMVNAKYEVMTRERIAALQSETTGPDGSKLEANRRKTPINIFDHIEPGVPKQRVLDLLETPTYIHGDRWYYRYEETQLEISFNEEGNAVDAVIMALCHGYIYQGTLPGHVVDVPFGKLTLADLLKQDDQVQVEFRSSMRTQEIFVQGRVGPPGAWTDYCYGALAVFSGAGNLQETNFEWDHETEKLVTNPKDVLINWMALPGSSLDAPYLSWFIK